MHLNLCGVLPQNSFKELRCSQLIMGMMACLSHRIVEENVVKMASIVPDKVGINE